MQLSLPNKEELKALAAGIVALDKDVATSTETRKEEHESYSGSLSDRCILSGEAKLDSNGCRLMINHDKWRKK